MVPALGAGAPHQRKQQQAQQQLHDHDPGALDANEPLDQTQPRERHVTIAGGDDKSSTNSASPSPVRPAQRAASVHWQASSSSSVSGNKNTTWQKNSQGASTSKPISSSHHATVRNKAAIPRMHKYKPSPAQQVQAVFKEVLHLLEAEWPTIRSLNLGVLSGTAVVEDVMMKRLKQLTGRLHTLTIERDEAADMLASLVKAMPKAQFQQLQVLMDSTDHVELADYLRLTLYDSSDPFAGALQRPGSYFGRKTQRMTSMATGSMSSRSLMDGSVTRGSDHMSMLRASSSGLSAGHSYTNSGWIQTAAAPSNPADNSLRFAARLPPGHALVAMAESLKREQDFARVLREAAEQAAADQAELDHMDHVLMFDDGPRHGTGEAGSSRVFMEHMRRTITSRGSARSANSRGGSAKHHHHHQSPPHSPTHFRPGHRFTAPLVHIEDLWAAGRKAQAVAVRRRGGVAAEVEHGSLLGTLLLVPPTGVSTRVLQPVQEQCELSASGSSSSHRSSGVPPLPLDRRSSMMPAHMARLTGAGAASGSGRISIGGNGAATRTEHSIGGVGAATRTRSSIGGIGTATRTASGARWMAATRDTRGPSTGGAALETTPEGAAEGGSRRSSGRASASTNGSQESSPRNSVHSTSGVHNSGAHGSTAQHSGGAGNSPRSALHSSSVQGSRRPSSSGDAQTNAGAAASCMPLQHEHDSSSQRGGLARAGIEQGAEHMQQLQSVKRRPLSGLGRATYGAELAVAGVA